MKKFEVPCIFRSQEELGVFPFSFLLFFFFFHLGPMAKGFDSRSVSTLLPNLLTKQTQKTKEKKKYAS